MSTMDHNNRRRPPEGGARPVRAGAGRQRNGEREYSRAEYRERVRSDVRDARRPASDSPRNASTNHDARGGRNVPGGNSRNMPGGNNRLPRKSKKDIAKDKMIIMIEVLIGLLLVSAVAFVAAKIFGILSAASGMEIGSRTIGDVKVKVAIVVVLELLGIVLLFAGIIAGRRTRLRKKLALDGKQRKVLLALEVIGATILLVVGVIGYIIFSDFS